MDAKTDPSAISHLPDLAWPPAGVSDSVPFGVFTDQATYDLEQERVFRPTWNYLALEAEIPNAGDYKSTFLGDTPVVVTRDTEGEIHAWVNRCAHRGAMVCRENQGNNADGTYTCVYHQWAFDAKGDLIGVPFRRGLGGKGVAACSSCHSPTGQGNAFAGFPSLSGQPAAYVVQQLTEYREGRRKTDEVFGGMMRGVAEGLTDTEISLLANYLQGLH